MAKRRTRFWVHPLVSQRLLKGQFHKGTEPNGEVKYFAKYSLTAVPVTLPLVPTALILLRGHSYNVSRN
jgi:hypothetical protein